MTPRTLAIALRSYLLPLPRTTAFRFSLVGVVLIYLLALLIRMMGHAPSIDGELSFEMGKALLMPGVPIFALLVSELPLREGIRHRTILYPLLGPASRDSLAWVRSSATALLFGLGFGLVVVGVEWIGGRSLSLLGAPFLAALLGGVTFTAVFGFIQLLLTRGLAAGLLWYFLFDESLAKVPFELCRLSVSYHVRVLAGMQEFFELPVASVPAEHRLVSALVLVVITVVSIVATMFVFRRRDLTELC